MAQLGQCKTCHTMVSMEALACPRCGQPNPGIIFQDGIYSAVVECVIEDSVAKIGFVFQNGLSAMYPVNFFELYKYEVGQTVRVKITNLNNGRWVAVLID